MSVIQVPGIPNDVLTVVQQGTLERVFHDALFPRQLYRLEAVPEMWQANLGEQMVFTRTGLIQPNINPLTPASDPTPAAYSVEQWIATASQYGITLDTHMPSSYVSLASLFLRNTQQLGLSAGQSLDRLARNNMFAAYLAGEAQAFAAAAAAATQIRVTSLNGLSMNLFGGKLLPVSASNPLPVTFSSVGEPGNNIINATPDNPLIPNGPGTITLSAPLVAGVAIRDAIYAGTRSRRLRVGGGATLDSLSTANILVLDNIIAAVSRLREMNVPTHSDGRYHVHLSPQAEAELFQDNHWQRQYQSLPDSYQYKNLAVGEAVGCIFFRNTEDPKVNTVSSTQAMPGGAGGALLAPEIGEQITNASGVAIRRTLVTGGGVVYEKYLDESKYITDAGVTGKIGEFSIVNGGVQVMTNRIRFIIRSPLDRLQQVVSQTWSWSGDFPVPSDATSGDAARFKRAVVIEHA